MEVSDEELLSSMPFKKNLCRNTRSSHKIHCSFINNETKILNIEVG